MEGRLGAVFWRTRFFGEAWIGLVWRGVSLGERGRGGQGMDSLPMFS